MKLKSLAQHNQERMDSHRAAQKMNEPHPNGLACPECGKELWDSTPMMVLTSNPPQKNVHCPACGHRGYATL